MRPRTKTILGLLAVTAAGVALRFVPAPRIFTFAYVNFQGDAWYHLRRLDWHLANFPSTLTNDAYANNVFIPLPPLFDLILAFFVALAGWPAPGTYAADVAAAVAPAVLGGLVAVPVFLLARRLASRPAAWIAAVFAVILPGPFLMRSTVGVADHHVAEVLFTSLALAVLIEAMGRTDERPLSFAGARLGALAGAFLAAYFLVWSGAAFIVPALAAGVALEIWGDVWHGRAHEGRFIPLAAAAGVAFALVMAFQSRGLYRFDLQYLSLVTLLAFVAVGALVVAVTRRVLPPRRAGLALFALAVLAGMLALRHPALSAFAGDFSRVFGGGASTVGETRSLMAMSNDPVETVTTIFGWGFMGLIALPWLVTRVWKRPTRGSALLLAWTVLTLVATVGQIRFGYYLVPNLAILIGMLLGPLWQSRFLGSRLAAAAAAVLILGASTRAIMFSLVIDEGAPLGWHQAMSWLRRTSPEPFGDPAFYFATPPDSRPEARVLTWWDYGYLVERIGRRVALSNPTQYFADVAGKLLTAPIDEDNSPTFKDLALKTVVVSDEMLMHLTSSTELFGKYATMLSWGGREPTRYMIAVDEKREDGSEGQTWLFLPDYFTSLAVHLYVYDGRAVAARDVWVFTLDPAGSGLRVAASRSFPDQAAAERYRASLGPGRHILASRDPFRTCVDLKARAGFSLAFESDDASLTGLGRASVRVFNYAPTP
ncbi:MAG: hypothetical protein K1Y01_11375 [Vicinamibacteria bacterium]|nr:hypothetical protein [Vicinamibacteria bacterium]